ncbi:hypothetical protein SAY87_027368 [Trapa incisa]|uniref:Uncharacterized protein n=1 Tax=Trapa incisa TaxID=236973 RepID=A0AAN7JLR4_9MYRT|nr:hypothetical protein SAY87_027368 [Trapa incisa]
MTQTKPSLCRQPKRKPALAASISTGPVLSTDRFGANHFCQWLQTQADMDTSNPSVLVNADLLSRYVGRKVRTVIQVIRIDGTSVLGKSTDDRQLVVKGSPPSSLTTFVEVIGIADSQSSIAADSWTNFGDSFGVFQVQFPRQDSRSVRVNVWAGGA